MYIDESTAIAIIVALIASLVMVSAIIFLIRKVRRLNREKTDRPLVENHKLKMRPPTWRFQKYHPTHCPHYNGIYRKVSVKVLEETIEKTIFVCADCVSTIEREELEQRDKFKK